MSNSTEQHEHFMRFALQEASQALQENEFPVGCILVCDGEIIGRGRRIHTLRASRNELDHAEMVALRQLTARQRDIQPARLTAYCTMEPCLMCYAALLLSQVAVIVYAYEDAMGGGTRLPLGDLAPLYRGSKTTVIPHVLRQESLTLFKQYFMDPAHSYWRDSLLADYTLSQPISPHPVAEPGRYKPV